MKKILKLGIVAITFFCIMVIWNRIYSVPERIRQIILNNESDYTKVAEIYYKDFNSYNAFVLVYSDGKNGSITCYTSQYDHEIILSEEEFVSFKQVHSSYLLDEKSLDRVYVYDNFVSFCNVRGRQSLVYSINGTPPAYVDAPYDNDKHIFTRKITVHWYYVYESR
ncbi:MAG: hypothetical protein NC428_07530 [Clostridium sp.]|nr:hypothetical protein [Clostridium sp.]